MIDIVSKNINGTRIDFPKKVWDKVCSNLINGIVVKQVGEDVEVTIIGWGVYTIKDFLLRDFIDLAEYEQEKAALKLFELGLPLDYIKMNNK